jgi:hypothetical protein
MRKQVVREYEARLPFLNPPCLSSTPTTNSVYHFPSDKQ